MHFLGLLYVRYGLIVDLLVKSTYLSEFGSFSDVGEVVSGNGACVLGSAVISPHSGGLVIAGPKEGLGGTRGPLSVLIFPGDEFDGSGTVGRTAVFVCSGMASLC